MPVPSPPVPPPPGTAAGGPRKIAVLGAGSWGTTFAKVLADSARAAAHARHEPPARTVVLWGRDADAMGHVARTHVNDRYVPGIRLPGLLQATGDLAAAVHGADLVVLAVPAQALRAQLAAAAPHLDPEAVLLSLAKGLERDTGLRMSEVVAEELGRATDRDAEHWRGRTCVLSGPNLAMEIAEEQPTASVVAAPTTELATWVAHACRTRYFRPYTNTDVVGTEIGGVVKNVIALSVGIADGRHFGENSKASIITRGLAETTRLALALGGRLETLSGLAGMGDLVATCSSPLSRNRTAGRLLGLGATLAEVQEEMTQTAEGIKSAPAVLALARRHGVDMPITEAVVAILREDITVDDLAPLLLGREIKSEGTTP
ncbi:NAD(P)H-dependent glycerol-3-phosphate dehydrogenase [Kocuria sediminis]|uniref:Glycerol-3-phosphate dehydrogenase [NAD(P)+] n=1 Tax=Kocuria sediminis TaxID=1038857 RepID=A0A6N8GLK3_9MICC|nr:NAD(P)H-dependent glycerol-3-phosphate dehydrogenase [Kocuria sediminis]MUN61835.1 NAD(P)H-dependent glycerol-3-phosphate dehydrogenase [Kocuria sediminis]